MADKSVQTGLPLAGGVIARNVALYGRNIEPSVILIPDFFYNDLNSGNVLSPGLNGPPPFPSHPPATAGDWHCMVHALAHEICHHLEFVPKTPVSGDPDQGALIDDIDECINMNNVVKRFSERGFIPNGYESPY